MLRALGLWAPVFGFMAAVWFLSDDMSAHTPELIYDKLLHALAYGCFGLVNLRAFHGGFRRIHVAASIEALALTAAFGALDEWRQVSLAYRHGSVGDWLADLTGGLIAWLVFRAVVQRSRKGSPR